MIYTMLYNGLMTQTPATERQASFILSLLEKKTGFTQEFAERVREGLSTHDMTKAKASEVITWLLAKPNMPKPATVTRMLTPLAEAAIAKVEKAAAPGAETVPQGYYAVASATGHNDLDFYRVDCPTEGKWAGYVFVKRVIGGHPEHAVRGAEKVSAMERIALAGAAKAAELYGQEIGRCSCCNRSLTDALSRACGMGPHCRVVNHFVVTPHHEALAASPKFA